MVVIDADGAVLQLLRDLGRLGDHRAALQSTRSCSQHCGYATCAGTHLHVRKVRKRRDILVDFLWLRHPSTVHPPRALPCPLLPSAARAKKTVSVPTWAPTTVRERGPRQLKTFGIPPDMEWMPPPLAAAGSLAVTVLHASGSHRMTMILVIMISIRVVA